MLYRNQTGNPCRSTDTGNTRANERCLFPGRVTHCRGAKDMEIAQSIGKNIFRTNQKYFWGTAGTTLQLLSSPIPWP